ncbi:hypothetical protein BC832DRAFT_593219 [Gaertneriomyces semiglobifer]|nr:hypothetical protein BC832DRAFT_593219 [Gaertneriomyces semiglobifer]
MDRAEEERTFRVLILGDGNFSFSLALCRILWPRPFDPVVSSENAHAGTSQKYPESKEILDVLESSRFASERVKVMHGVNAWELQSQFGAIEKFDVIVWNHPHLGTEDFRLHRFLMAHFFQSVASVLNPNSPLSSVCVSLVEGQETRWDIVAQGARANLGLKQIALFDETLWPGYVVKRNKHGGSFKNMHTKKHTQSDMKSHLFRFGFGQALIDWTGLESAAIDRNILASKSKLIPEHGGGRDVDSHDIGETLGEAVQKIQRTLDSTPCSPNTVKPMKSNRKSRRLAAIPADLVCPHCSKQLTSARGWTQHVHMVHTLQQFGEGWVPDRARTIRCTFADCEKTFADEGGRWQHEINKHSSLEPGELPAATEQLAGNGSHSADGDDYDYVPCDVCGQAVVKRDWGMTLHLETLKPAVGLDMRCPLCEAAGVNSTFIESRALFQHYKFCRTKTKR